MIHRAPVTAVRLGGRPDQPLLVLGPALGSTARDTWAAVATHLAEEFQVVAWDLPGHGTNRAPVEESFTVAGLAAGVLEVVDAMGDGLQPPTFDYVGVGVGGAVGLQLLLDAPGRVESATLLATGAVAAEPAEADAAVPAGVDAEGHAAVRGALAGFDVRRRLGRVGAPVLAVAGADDPSDRVEALREVADGVRAGRLVVLDGAGHPVRDAPGEVARLVREHALGPPATTVEDLARELRAVLGAGGDGLDRRSRGLVVLTALVASGQLGSLPDAVRGARRDGVRPDELTDLVVEVAQHCGVPLAEAALDAVRSVLLEEPAG